ncbi:50S ribosomal protein L29 [Candidatus Daviesbacteria bacterium]|nr:50S ribosomal protein L29 [Candidatus Daviesbacteria bacterium]
MKKNELNQIKGLSVQELFAKAKILRKEIEDAVLDKNMNKLKDTKLVFKKRKVLAKILTIIRQKQLLEELEAK